MNFFHVKPHNTGFFKTKQLGASGTCLLPVLKNVTVTRAIDTLPSIRRTFLGENMEEHRVNLHSRTCRIEFL